MLQGFSDAGTWCIELVDSESFVSRILNIGRFPDVLREHFVGTSIAGMVD